MNNSYPVHVANKYISLLRRHYNLDDKVIFKETGINEKYLSDDNIILYPNDCEVIALLNLANELEYFTHYEIEDIFSLKSEFSGFSGLIFHNLHAGIANQVSLVSYLQSIKKASTLFPAHAIDFSLKGNKAIITHSFNTSEREFGSSQGVFTNLSQSMKNIYGLNLNSVNYFFNNNGLKNESEFKRINLGEINDVRGCSFMEFDIENLNLANKYHNPYIGQLNVEPKLLPSNSFREKMATSIRNFFDKNGYIPKKSEIIKTMNVSESTLYRELIKEGETFFLFIKKYKDEKARGMLKNTNTPIQEIASMLGYTDSTSFIRSFRLENSITPLVYRKTMVSSANRLEFTAVSRPR